MRELCETRWSARADALSTFLNGFDVIVHALGHLAANGDSKADSFLDSIMKYDFIIALVTAEHVLQATVGLANLLQKKSLDLLGAVKESQTVTKVLNAE